jgi:hypothetical protein
MNLSQWQALIVGDLVHWHDRPDDLYRLVEPIRPDYKTTGLTYPIAWKWERVGESVDRSWETLDIHMREFWLALPRPKKSKQVAA